MESEDIRRRIEAAKNNDKSAFTELIKIYAGKIHGLCLKLTKEKSEAEDLFQEVFFRAFKKIRDYNERADFSTWLYRIAVNFWIDKKRRDKIVRFVTFSTMTKADEDLENKFGDILPGPEKQSEDEELKQKLEKAIKKLPEDQKIVVILRIYEDKSYEEIAEICKCSVGTVGSRLSRALISLRNILKDS